MSMKSGSDFTFYTAVDDELYDELSELVGQKVVFVAVWEDSLADALGSATAAPDDAADDTFQFDIDLYLADGVFFELYGTQCFSDLDAAPWRGLEKCSRQLVSLLNRGLWLEEVAVTEEDDLVLVLGQAGNPLVYFNVGGWLIEEWDELPDA